MRSCRCVSAVVIAAAFVPFVGSASAAGAGQSTTRAADPAVATDVAAGRGSSCAIVTDGEIYCWGSNTFGQLGTGTIGGRELEPAKVQGLSGAVEIGVGDDHACALLSDATVRCWGANTFGQLGDGSTTHRSTPVAVAGLTGVTSLAGGRAHTCAVVANGEVRCWGNNSRGQLGNGATPQNPPATPAPPPQLTPGPVVGIGGVGVLSGVTQVEAADAFHTCALFASGGIACWGWNQYGELGNGVQNAPFDSNRASGTPLAVVGIDNAVSTAVTGAGNSCALLADGTVKCFGWNTFGQLGQGGPAPGAIGDQTHSATPLTVRGLPAAVAITETSGTGQVCAIVTGGDLYCWGHNGLGQLGDGSNQHQSLPVPIPLTDVTLVSGGADHTCAIQAGQIYCWGYNNEGQLGDGLTINRTTPTHVEFVERPHDATPTAVPGVSGATAVGAGAQHACALIAGGKVVCWGDNRRGQLGTGSLAASSFPVVVRDLSGATAIAVGGDHSCAIVPGSELRCWGWNGVAQLGDGTFTNRSTPVTVSGVSGVTAVAAGRSHTCAVVAGGEVRCWGHNYVGGPLGATSGSQGGPIYSASPIVIKVNPSAPPEAQVPLTGATAVAIRGGHTCVQLSDGTARCWGFGTEGQLGTGTFQAAGPTPLTPSGLSGAAAITTGAAFSCALLTTGDARCWGQNIFGQVGDGTATGRNVPTPVSGLAGATAIGSGADHSCAVVAGSVRCWGWNGSGQIGDGTTNDALAPVPVPGLSGVTAVSAGWRNTCALLADGTVRCWGLSILSPVTCTVVVTGSHVGPLTVSDGVTCLDGARVSGPITVQAGAGLVATGARVTGPLTADSASIIRLCGTRQTGPVKLTAGSFVTLGAPDVGCDPNSFTGSVRVSNTSGPSVIAGDRIVGPLNCAGNDPAPTNDGHPNDVTGPTSGQCADL